MDERELLDESTVVIGGELALVERWAGDAGGVVDRVVLVARELGDVELDHALGL